MKKKVLLFFATAMLSIMGAKADVIPSSYYSDVAEGDFYLYNVTQQKFMAAESMSDSPTLMRLASVSSGVYTIQDTSTSKFEKMGVYQGKYLWSNNWDDSKDAFFKWSFTAAGTKTYKLSITASDQDGAFTEGTTYYLNTANSVTTTSGEADEWALITAANYNAYMESKIIPATYFSTVTDGGQYYLYDVLNQQFLKTSDRTLSDSPAELVTFTATGNKWLISGAGSAYLKIGVYRGQFLWSDGDANNTKWTLEKDGNAYYIYTNEFTEEDNAVAGKTWYITGTNTSDAQPSNAQWALITAANWAAYQANQSPEEPETPVTPDDPNATKYDLTLVDGSDAHGTVTFSVSNTAVTEAAKDAVVTVTVEVAEGWSVKDVTVRAYTDWSEAEARSLSPTLQDDIDVTAQSDGTWTFTMPDNNVLVKVSYVKTVVATLTIASGSYMTYYCDKGLNLPETTANGVKLYTVTAVNDKQVTLNELTEAAAGTPLLIYNGTDAEQEVTLVENETATTAITVADEFQGTLVTKEMSGSGNGKDYYILRGQNFVWVNGAGTIAANRCWIEIDSEKAAGARNLIIVIDGNESTDINDVRSKVQEAEGGYFDLSGRRVAQPTKGLYIVNGKKVVIK